MKERQPKKLKGISAAATSLLLAACGTGAIGQEQNPQSEPQNYTGDIVQGNEVLGISDRPIGELFNEFFTDWNGKFNDIDKYYGPQCVDLANEWVKKLGYGRFGVGWAKEMFGKYPDIYRSIPRDSGEKPQVGDIFVWSNDKGGHTGIFTGKYEEDGDAIVFQQNDPKQSNSHEKAYSLGQSDLSGWMRALAYETPPTPEDVFEQYLSPENSDLDQRFAAMGLKFWIDTFLSKKIPVEVYEPMPELNREGSSLQIDTNISDWLSEVPKILNSDFGEGWPSYSTESDKVFSYHYKFSGGQKDEGEVEIKNLRMLAYGTSDFTEVDKANGWERFESVAIKYISRHRYLDPETNSWTQWSDWDDTTEREGRDYYSYRIKDGQTEMYCVACDGELDWQNARFYLPNNQHDNPTLEIPYFIDTREN